MKVTGGFEWSTNILDTITRIPHRQNQLFYFDYP